MRGNHDADSEAHDDEFDDGCTTEIPAGQIVRNPVCSVRSQTRVEQTSEDCSLSLAKKTHMWEVYVGAGLVSYYLSLCCVEVKQFGLEKGWDLTDKNHSERS